MLEAVWPSAGRSSDRSKLAVTPHIMPSPFAPDLCTCERSAAGDVSCCLLFACIVHNWQADFLWLAGLQRHSSLSLTSSNEPLGGSHSGFL